MSSYVARTFLKYSVIFSENTRGDSAYLLQEGRVELSQQVAGRKKVLAILNPISMFGEMALVLGDQRRTATAIAKDDIRVVEIKKDNFDDFIRESPQIMQTVLDVLVHRLRKSTKKAMQVPSLFQGTCRTMELLCRHGCTDLDYITTISNLKDAFTVEEDRVLDILEKLEHLQMLNISNANDGNKRIKLLQPENFTSEAANRLQAHSKGESII